MRFLANFLFKLDFKCNFYAQANVLELDKLRLIRRKIEIWIQARWTQGSTIGTGELNGNLSITIEMLNDG